ncbi:hypothetical protein [Pseudoalteromonas sp. G4]|uniref:hypothetical protein n=1 Tax=Pseudoalteromonas sp. G4 TaxID=2992761 RepID=UPI00237EA08C|nr:hypothetical protein [Pseudoalteromonas sp. G4]MDE3270440.1 hypothetical protein [Pseudoalteromonas sp. G4]
MRLDTAKQQSNRGEQLKLVFSLLLLAILLLPSTGAVKRFLVDKGFVATHLSSKEKAVQLASSLISLPYSYLTAKTDLPLIKVDIKYQDWLKLEEDRRSAFERGIIPENRSQVSGVIYFGKEKYEAKVRLQGDMLDHVNKADRWSLKVELKKKQAMFGSRKFALVAPSVRVNQGPNLFANSLDVSGFDIISPQNIPVKLVVNGADWGVMLFEQAFSQDLLAVNNRTEGLITRLDLLSETTNSQGQVTRTLKPRVLQQKTILANQALANQRQIALALLDDFLTGKRPASDVFDAARLGQYLAMVDLWGAWHALTWNNWRWYYNPHIAKLEPIQSDVAVTPAKHIWLMKPPSHRFALSKAMLADDVVNAHYLAAKEQLLSSLDSKLIPALESYDKTFIKSLHLDSPLITPFNYHVMKQQAACWQNDYQSAECSQIADVSSELHKQMDNYKAKANWDLYSRLNEQDGKLVWQVTNTEEQPLIINSIEGITKRQEISPLEQINDELPVRIAPGETLALTLPSRLNAISARVALKGKGNETFFFQKDTAPLAFIPRGGMNPFDSTKYAHFITQSQNKWEFKAGEWEINDYLVTPTNTEVVIPQGTTLKFARNAGLMVFGSLFSQGTPNAPVIMTRQENTSKWSGLSVFAKDQNTAHQVDHLYISYASSPKLGLWQPRGAIYFVKGNVNMRTVQITDNQSEDGLNIINADVNIYDLTIKNALSDAFDCDFCTGVLDTSQFTNIGFRSGGDGIDVSGSTLTVKHAKFNNVRDKAISAGEHSQLMVSDTHFNDVNFGLVAKDNSLIEAHHVRASNIQHKALMSYSKKRIFGPAVMRVTDYLCTDSECNIKQTAELGSQLLVNGLAIQSEALDVKDLYNTVMKSDKPK